MFSRLKKAFSREPRASAEAESPISQIAPGPVSEWAGTQGFGFSVDAKGNGLSLEGKVGGKPWRMQVGAASRPYMRGDEIRARAELGIREDMAVVVMNRALKVALDKQAYETYTDQLQTSVDTSLPEEMRWLAIYNEVGWDSLPREFWNRYSVLADSRESAVAWIEPGLARMLLDWPVPGPADEVPFMIFLMRGKGYLRMEYSPPDLAVLQHGAMIFTQACEAALASFGHKPAA